MAITGYFEKFKISIKVGLFQFDTRIRSVEIYSDQQSQLNKLLMGMEAQLNAGNIAQKDFLRIQALQISLEQDVTDLKKQIADIQNDFKTLLQIKENVFVKPVENLANISAISTAFSEDILFDTGKVHNPYFQLQQTQTLFQQQNLSYQKSLRVPDITLGPNFDKNSNYAPNYVGLGLSIPLPVLNNNKGNIKSAEFSIKQQQAFTNNAETELKTILVMPTPNYYLLLSRITLHEKISILNTN